MSAASVVSQERIDHIFAQIRREGIDACRERWRGHFNKRTDAPDRIVLFGAGQFGQLTLDRLRASRVEPYCFSDNNQARWGSRQSGLDVLSPGDAVARYGDNATFVVTIFNGSAARAQLRQMGCRYVLSAACLFWKYPNHFMPDLGIDSPEFLREHEKAIRTCFGFLADERSRHEFCDQIHWRYWLDPEFLPRQDNPDDLYFPEDLVAPVEDEVIVDCGAFEGDVIQSLLRRRRNFEHLYALEPDRENRRRLQDFLSSQPSTLFEKITVWPYGVHDRDCTAHMTGTGDVASKITPSGNGDIGQLVELRRLDSLEWSSMPTYIKMDIEGAEPGALRGAARLLSENMPVLAVCLYHRSEHLWEIPSLIHTIQPGYRLLLRRYAEDCWEQVCYAVPKDRLSPELQVQG